MLYNVKKNQGSTEKQLILGLGQEMHKMSLQTVGGEMVQALWTSVAESSEPDHPHTL